MYLLQATASSDVSVLVVRHMAFLAMRYTIRDFWWHRLLGQGYDMKCIILHLGLNTHPTPNSMAIQRMDE